MRYESFLLRYFPSVALNKPASQELRYRKISAKVSLSMISKAWFFQLKLFSLALTVFDVDLEFWL